MAVRTSKFLRLIPILIISFVIIRCSSFPSSETSLANKVFIAFKKKSFNNLWKICMQNPSVRKNSLITLLREGKITKKVYQRDMGRVMHLAAEEKKKLKQDYARILNLINNLKIKMKLMGIIKKDKEKKFITIKIGKTNHNISTNIHYDIVNSNFLLISLYSIK